MKNYKVTFGTGKDAQTMYEMNCVSFAEVVIRLEYTGFDMTFLTKVELVDENFNLIN